MALSEIELKRAEKCLASFMARRRPPPEIRAKIDLGYRIANHSVELFETRPAWDNPALTHESPVAKATFVRSKNHWKIYWKRQDLKWHGYQPSLEVKTLDDFLRVVEMDEYGCFFG